jgi:hypothetical protein
MDERRSALGSLFLVVILSEAKDLLVDRNREKQIPR